MSLKRNYHNASLKSKVVKAALKEDKTLAELSSEFKVSSSRISTWKKTVVEGIDTLLSTRKKNQKPLITEVELEKLYAEIGRLKVERDYLKKNLNR